VIFVRDPGPLPAAIESPPCDCSSCGQPPRPLLRDGVGVRFVFCDASNPRIRPRTVSTPTVFWHHRSPRCSGRLVPTTGPMSRPLLFNIFCAFSYRQNLVRGSGGPASPRPRVLVGISNATPRFCPPPRRLCYRRACRLRPRLAPRHAALLEDRVRTADAIASADDQAVHTLAEQFWRRRIFGRRPSAARWPRTARSGFRERVPEYCSFPSPSAIPRGAGMNG